ASVRAAAGGSRAEGDGTDSGDTNSVTRESQAVRSAGAGDGARVFFFASASDMVEGCDATNASIGLGNHRGDRDLQYCAGAELRDRSGHQRRAHQVSPHERAADGHSAVLDLARRQQATDTHRVCGDAVRAQRRGTNRDRVPERSERQHGRPDPARSARRRYARGGARFGSRAGFAIAQQSRSTVEQDDAGYLQKRWADPIRQRADAAVDNRGARRGKIAPTWPTRATSKSSTPSC